MDNAQMLQQDFYPHQDEDDTPQNLHFRTQPVADPVADIHSREAQGKGDRPDDQGGRNDLYIEEGEADSHRQRVDAGGDRQSEQHQQVQGIALLLRFLQPHGFIDHLDPDARQQGESDPMVKALHIGFQASARQPTHHRHQSLEPSKKQRDSQRVARSQALDGDPAANRHGERVHRQTEPDKANLYIRQNKKKT